MGRSQDALWCTDANAKHLDTRMIATKEMLPVAQELSEEANKNSARRWVRIKIAPLDGVRQGDSNLSQSRDDDTD